MWKESRGLLESIRRSAELIATLLLMALVLGVMATSDASLEQADKGEAASRAAVPGERPGRVDAKLTTALWFATGESAPVALRPLGAIASVWILLGRPPPGARFASLCAKTHAPARQGLAGLIETIQVSREVSTGACAERISTRLSVGRSSGTLGDVAHHGWGVELDRLDWAQAATLAAGIGEGNRICRPARLRAARERLVSQLLSAGVIDAVEARRIDAAPLPRSVCFPPAP